jgi:hypothetical protein
VCYEVMQGLVSLMKVGMDEMIYPF